MCGDGILADNEQCDDGNTVDGDACSANCSIEENQSPVCGNEILEAGEACDDGDVESGDGCSATCTLESTPNNDESGEAAVSPNPAAAAGLNNLLEGQGGCMLTTTAVSNPMLYGLYAFALGMFAWFRRKVR